jgi:hypothetical protein
LTNWEYKTLSWNAFYKGEYQEDDEEVEDKEDERAGFHRAQALGRDEWELVGIQNNGAATQWVFKRPLPE